MKRFCLCLVCILLIGCREPVDGFVWQVKSEDTIIYIMGSIHVGDYRMYPFSDKTEALYKNCDYLVVEKDMTVPVKLNEIYYEGDDLFNHLTEDAQEKIIKKCELLSIDVEAIRKRHIWAAGMTISQVQFKKTGLKSTHGVDQYFIKKAQKNEKEILELEPVDYTIEFYNGLTDELQEKAFMNFISPEESENQLNKLYKCYINNDFEGVKSLMLDDENIYMDEILRLRHDEMCQKIESFLDTKHTYYIVVGMQHLIGEDNILTRLKENDYLVERY